MAGLLDPSQGDGTYVENRPSKWAQTWGILGPYVTEPVTGAINWTRNMMNASPYTLMTDTGPQARALAEGGAEVATNFMGASSVVPKPDDALNMGIKAFHGSPHDFDRFSLDKIGTGEGAQAYGHGLYFAENEGIARSYRDALSPAVIDGRPVDYSAGSDLASSWFTAFKDRAKAADYLQRQIDNPPKSAPNFRSPEEIQSMRDAIAILRGDAPISETKPSGRMYEVEIDADPDAFLDWDKPLSEQPEAVRRLAGWTPEAEAQYRGVQRSDTDALLAALEGDAQYSPARMPRPLEALVPLSATGDELHQKMFHQARKELGGQGGGKAYQAQVAEKLREAGIPGIKYLDAGSRSAGDGSRNYVVFDDNLINIIRKYGIAGLLGGSAAMDAMMSEPQEQY